MVILRLYDFITWHQLLSEPNEGLTKPKYGNGISALTEHTTSNAKF